MMPPPQLLDIFPSSDAEELIDFTCATPWERLVLDVELKLREWNLHASASKADVERSTKQSFAVTLVCLGARELSLQYIHQQNENIATILGVGECVVLGPPSVQSDAAVDASDAAVLLSALTAAAEACASVLPMIVRVGSVDALRLIGRQGGSRPRRFCCDYTSYPSGPITQLSGILQLFHNKRVAARRMCPPPRSDANITAMFTYYWSDFSFAVTAAPDSFASDPILAPIHRPVLSNSDPVPYLMLYVGWNSFHASQVHNTSAASHFTGPVAGLTTRHAGWFRLAPPRDTFTPAATIPSSSLPLTNSARACLRLMHKASLKSSRPRPAAPRPLIGIHAAASSSHSPDDYPSATGTANRLVETKSAPALRTNADRLSLNCDGTPTDADEKKAWGTFGPPPNGMDNFFAQVSEFIAAAAVGDDKLDEDFLSGAIASLFGLDDSRGLVSEVVEALGPGVPEMTAIERISRLAGASGSLSMALRLWGLFLDGVELHWRNRWLLSGVPFDRKVGPSMGGCLILQKLEMLNCCVLRLHDRAQQQTSPEGGLGSSQSLGRKKKLWPLHATKGDGGKRKRTEGVSADSDRLCQYDDNDGNDAGRSSGGIDGQDGFVWEPSVQPLPFVTRDMVEAEQRKMVRNASLTGSAGGKSQADIKQQSSALKSDMMSFKAANPAATMSDFVRWFSPSDWLEDEETPTTGVSGGDGSGQNDTKPREPRKSADSLCRPGRLSQRMRAPGNLWQELWDSVVPTPAYKQVPLFDAHMHGLKALADLRAFPLKEVIRQFACVQASYASRTLQRAFERPPLLPSIVASLATARQSCVSCQLTSLNDDAEGLATVADMCDKLATAEHMAIGAASLVAKLPPSAEFTPVINALVSGEQIDIISERERSALSLVAGMEEHGWRTPLIPSYREFVVQGSDDDRMHVKLSSESFRVGVRLGLEYATR